MSRLPKWFVNMREKESESVKAKANKQEKDFAKRASNLGARRQPASGALWSAKGDVRIGGLALGDNKFTKNKSLSITKGMWRRLRGKLWSRTSESLSCKLRWRKQTD